ncbi:proteasome subunit beta type-2-like [Bombyx mandarina]|uniref:Proteasome subunit beta n=1 Tax=Bombyx mandarina TaxID=7092 RepID=A0A6J2KJ88_BOMMA|nr:proteasome subunit beta type-2-like [Bombyx mandarina]
MTNPSTSLYLQCLIGIQCQDFVLVAADQTNIQSIIVMSDDEDKLHNISDSLVMGVIGDHADAVHLQQYITKNLQLYKLKNGYELDTPAVVHFTRRTLSDSLKNGNPTMVNMLLAGYDRNTGSALYALDFLASCVKVPYAVHGFGGIISLGILDDLYRPTLSQTEAYEVLKVCIREIQKRLFANLKNFQVKIVSRCGIKTLPTINADTFSK